MISIQILMQRYAQVKILGYILYILFILCIGPAGNQGWGSGGVRSKRVSNWGTLGLRCRFSGTLPVRNRSSPSWHKDGVNDVSYHRGLRTFWIKLTHKQIYCKVNHAQNTFEALLTIWCLGCAEYWPLDRSGSCFLIQTQTRICTQSQCIQNMFVEIFFLNLF